MYFSVLEEIISLTKCSILSGRIYHSWCFSPGIIWNVGCRSNFDVVDFVCRHFVCGAIINIIMICGPLRCIVLTTVNCVSRNEKRTQFFVRDEFACNKKICALQGSCITDQTNTTRQSYRWQLPLLMFLFPLILVACWHLRWWWCLLWGCLFWCLSSFLLCCVCWKLFCVVIDWLVVMDRDASEECWRT